MVICMGEYVPVRIMIQFCGQETAILCSIPNLKNSENLCSIPNLITDSSTNHAQIKKSSPEVGLCIRVIPIVVFCNILCTRVPGRYQNATLILICKKLHPVHILKIIANLNAKVSPNLITDSSTNHAQIKKSCPERGLRTVIPIVIFCN